MEPSLNIPFSFARENFSQSWWSETATVLARLGLDLAPADLAAETADGDELIGPDELDDEGELPDLSPAQARKLVNNVSDRLRTTFKIIAQAPEAGFTVKDVAQALGDEDEGGALRGVWSGITRRLRSVLGDGDAYLFEWEEDESGATWKGMVSPTTHRSLRKALGVE